jgi:hypothetical protein
MNDMSGFAIVRRVTAEVFSMLIAGVAWRRLPPVLHALRLDPSILLRAE